MSNIRPGIPVLIIFLILAAISVTVYAAPNEAGCMKVITENYNGKTIQITQGDSFCLRLKENPSTGYSWQLGLNKGLSLVSSEYYPPYPSNNAQRFIVGAAGFHSWKIKAVARGNQQVNGIYRRSWEKGTGEEHTFRLNVKVI
jgi:inhibitor of cysteine peptidase